MTTHEPAESKARKLFEMALAKSPSERRAFLDGMGGSNAELRRRVEALLEAHEELGDFLAAPTEGAGATAATGEAEGTVIGNYKLRQRIGEGGMGTVWMAEQFEPVRRKVAFKIIKLGMDTRQVVARFEAERQALAMMDHPHIAKVLDGGMTDTGRPYFVMELVKGMPITQFCDEMKLSLDKRLDLFIQVCHAIQHAHGKGIIHRDIKPSNVMVTLHDGVPVPKVIDFGVAKATNAELTQKTLFTEHQQILGTPEYMSPEQTAMSGLDVDTRADVYSLGVLLYELLSGSKPFDLKSLLSEGYGEVLRTIREEDPPKPSTRASTMLEDTGRISLQRQLGEGQLGKALRGDLDWIVMRCIEKDRDRRYETASGLAMDIARFLQGEPVTAAPPSAAYRLRKFVRRHKVGVAAGTAVVLALLLGIIGTTLGMTRAISQSERAERAEQASARELARATEVKGVLKQMIMGIKPEEAQGVDTTLLKQIVDQAAERLKNGEIEDELIAAEMHMLLGNAYATIGAYEDAAQHLPKSVEIRTRLLGAEHAETLESRAQLALLHGYQGRHGEAARILEEVIPAAQRAYGEGDARLYPHLQNLSWVYWDLHENARSEQYAQMAYEIAKRAHGEDHDHTLSALNNIANVRRAQGREDEALDLWRKVLAARRRTLGDDHPALLTSLTNLGRANMHSGHYKEARRYLEEARRIGDRAVDPKSAIALHLATNWAELQIQLGNLEEARKTLLGAADVLGRHYSPEHRGNLDVKLLFAKLYAQEGRRVDAARFVGEAVELERRVLGDDSPRAVNFRTNCGDVYMKLQRYAEVRALFEPIYQLRMKQLGPDHVDTLRTKAVVAYARAASGDVEDAAREAVEAHERMVDLLGPDDLRTDKVARIRAFVVARAGRLDEADALYRASLARWKQDDSLEAAVLDEFSTHCANFGKLEQATELRREQVAILERMAGPTNIHTLNAKRTIAAYLHHQGHYADAEQLHDEVVAGLRETIGADHALTIEVECQASITLGALRKFEAAERMLLDVVGRIERQWGKEHIINAEAHRCLGRVYMDWRRIPDAERCLEFAVEVQEKLTGAPPIEDLERLAMCARARGAPDVAVRFLDRAVKTGREQWGPKATGLVRLLASLAEAEQAAGHADAARRAWVEALPIARAGLPESDPQRLRLLAALAAVYRGDQKHAEAVELLQELVAIARKTQGAGSMAELSQLMDLGLSLNALGRFDEAERTMRTGLEDAGKKLGAINRHAGFYHLVLGLVYAAQGRWDEALKSVDDAEPAIRSVHGTNSVIMQVCRLIRGDCLSLMGRPAEAIEVLEPAVAWMRSAAPSGDGTRTGITSLLVRVYDETGETEKAEPLLAEVLPHQLKALEGPKPDAEAFANAARSLLYERHPRFHDPARALEFARRACQLDQQTGSASAWQRLYVLARAQFQTGDKQGARAALRRAIELAPEGRRPELEAQARKFDEDGE